MKSIIILGATLTATAMANPIAPPDTAKVSERCTVTIDGNQAHVTCVVGYKRLKSGDAPGAVSPFGPGNQARGADTMSAMLPVLLPAGAPAKDVPEMVKARLKTEGSSGLEPRAYGRPSNDIHWTMLDQGDFERIKMVLARESAKEALKREPSEEEIKLYSSINAVPLSRVEGLEGLELHMVEFVAKSTRAKTFTLEVSYTQPLHKGRFVYLPQFEDGPAKRNPKDFAVTISAKAGATVKQLLPRGGNAGANRGTDKLDFLPQHGKPIVVEVTEP